ncbi:MAG TPA: hypothetical protein VF570_18810 [Pyrinomonadaceae bacterium]
MYPAMCFDTGMLVGLLFFVLIVGAVIATPIVFAVVVLLRRINARQEGLAEES